MKRRIFQTAIFALVITTAFLFTAKTTHGQQCGSKEECEKTMQELEQKLADTKKQKNTLASEIDFMDTQIRLTTVKIKNTENEVLAETPDRVLTPTTPESSTPSKHFFHRAGQMLRPTRPS